MMPLSNLSASSVRRALLCQRTTRVVVSLADPGCGPAAQAEPAGDVVHAGPALPVSLSPRSRGGQPASKQGAVRRFQEWASVDQVLAVRGISDVEVVVWSMCCMLAILLLL